MANAYSDVPCRVKTFLKSDSSSACGTPVIATKCSSIALKDRCQMLTQSKRVLSRSVIRTEMRAFTVLQLESQLYRAPRPVSSGSTAEDAGSRNARQYCARNSSCGPIFFEI